MGRLAGALQPGDKVAITEDTVTRGSSLMEAVEVVRQFGAEPVLVTLIVDRGDTCAAMCEQAGVAYAPLLTAPDLGSVTAPEGNDERVSARAFADSPRVDSDAVGNVVFVGSIFDDRLN